MENNELPIKELQAKGLEMLVFFQDFCNEHNLRFFLCGGCCIGAVRHGGFIPWDDDVDVFMLREDYEKLIEIFNAQSQSQKYFLQVTTNQTLTKNQFATINDSQTTFIKSFQKDLDINHGLVLDIIPLDACPSGFNRKVQKFWALIYSLFVIGQAPKNNGKLIEIIGSFLLFLAPTQKFKNKIWQFAKKQMSKYSFDSCEFITELCSGVKYMQNEYPKEIFKSAVLVDFEDIKAPLPIGYDQYLKMAFGDYMSLPKQSERAAHHELEFIDMDNSYKIYKGKYYYLNGGK